MKQCATGWKLQHYIGSVTPSDPVPPQEGRRAVRLTSSWSLRSQAAPGLLSSSFRSISAQDTNEPVLLTIGRGDRKWIQLAPPLALELGHVRGWSDNAPIDLRGSLSRCRL